MPLKKIWSEIIKNLGSVIPEPEINTWFSNTECIRIDENSAVIRVPNKFVAAWLYDNYYDIINNSFKKVINRTLDLQFIYNKNKNLKLKDNKNQDTISLNSLMNFNNFITGDCNLFAYSSSLAVSEKPGDYYSPFYIFSKEGVGKTHLLNSIGNKLKANNKQSNLSYINSKNFILDYNYFSKNKDFNAFKEKYIKLDVLLFDDIEYLSKSSRLQDEFISIFDYFNHKKRQIVITGNRAPSDFNKLNGHLRSRLGSGLIAEIKETDEKSRTKILKSIIKKKNLPLAEDIFIFLIKTNNDIKKIIKNIIRIETYYSLNKGNLNLSLVKSIIKDRYNINVDIEEIQSVIAGYFNISTSDILSDKKRSVYTYPRHLAMYMSRNLTYLSYKEIGCFFGNRDHSSVIYATKKIEQSVKKNNEVRKDINNIKNLLT